MSYQPTFHLLDSRKLDEVTKENSIDLVITSPPYPHVEMWNSLFIELDPTIPPVSEWNISNAFEIFEKMHAQLDIVWTKLFKVVKESGIVIINVGDATRTFPTTKGSATMKSSKQFQLFPNASRITMAMMKIGFTALPNIYWKKISNKPNSFLGSGFLPVNAYVTLDCEHILIFRKGNIRKFKPKDENRKNSEFTKEERDLWFSQTWTGINGVKQTTKGVTKGVKGKNKERTGAFPEEIPRRLIKMYSVKGDTVLDPFCGTKTTLKVAEKLERKSIGLDIKDL